MQLAGSWDGRRGIRVLQDLWRRRLYNPELVISKVHDGLGELDRGYADQAAGSILWGVTRLG